MRAKMLAVLAFVIFGLCEARADVVLVLTESNDAPSGALVDRLNKLGHTVNEASTLEDVTNDLDTYDSIWHLGFGAITPESQTMLIEYIQDGGGVHLTGVSESPGQNDSVENIINAVLESDQVDLLTSGQSGQLISNGEFNPNAIEGIGDGLGFLNTGIAGIVNSIGQDENVLARSFEQMDMMIYDIGGVWSEQHMAAGFGRLTLIMDHEWPGAESGPIVDNIQQFLASGAQPDDTCRADCDNTGTVDFNDLICVLFEFGDCPAPE